MQNGMRCAQRAHEGRIESDKAGRKERVLESVVRAWCVVCGAVNSIWGYEGKDYA